ncbi:MAG: ComF family protein [Bacteroidetes bacterium]|nr:ComF family protein [Bacteroidota bacterium]
MFPVVSAVLDVLYPPLCLACGLRLRAGEYLCAVCLRDAVPLPLNVGQSSAHISSLACACDATMMLVGWEYEGGGVIERCIHAMKYRRLHSAGIWLGRLLAERLLQETNPGARGILDAQAILLPVPLHRIKRIERGFNQADYLCRGISSESGLEWDSRLLLRRRYTTSQSASKLDRDERQRNVRDAFHVDRAHAASLNGRPLILVDDLVTTGATICACVDTLIAAGFTDVRILAIARPPRH